MEKYQMIGLDTDKLSETKKVLFLLVINSLKNEIGQCNTIVFNGPMGVFEMKPFATGTITVAKD